MNTDAIKKFRSKLTASHPVYGLWVTLESASITEMAVALGMDWIVVDAEHGHLDWSQILEHIRAAVRSETVVLVRIAERNTVLAKRALDIGADGIVIPMVETVEQLLEAQRDCWYPPEGRRGIGGERATAWGQCLMEHAAEANEQVLVVPIIETARTLPAVMAMSEVSGTSVFFFGPADLSATSGYRGHWEGPGIADQIIAAKDILRSAGKYCGVLTRNPEDLTLRLSQQFQMLGLGTDAGMLLRSMRDMLRVAGRDRNPATSLDPRDGSLVHETLQAPPERMLPEVGEVITRCGAGSEIELQRGVVSSGQNFFRIALTADFYDESGQPRYEDLGLSVFEGHKHIEVTNFARHDLVIQPEQLAGARGVIVLTPRVTRESLANSHELLAIGRFGVGYDSVDVSACTEANVLAMIASGAVNHSMAEATVAWMLALTHHVSVKDRLTRTGRWHDRSGFMGCELRDRTLGVIGFGGIGRSLVRMLAGFQMKQPVVFDPFVSPGVIEENGGRAVGLDELLSTADFVSVHCPFTDSTRGMIGRRELNLMKPTAYLLNTARGGIVDESALLDALREKRIAGAALDCFDVEPVVDLDRFEGVENLLLAPHSIGWTNELFRDIGQTACQSMLDLSLGRRPIGVLNPELFEQPVFIEKWARIIGHSDSHALLMHLSSIPKIKLK